MPERWRLGALLLSMGGVACPAAPTPQPVPAGPPDLILVSMDTVRWDHTGIGGHDRDTTPHLDLLAQQPGAVTFERASTPATWSMPAYASLFTGRGPMDHGLGFLRTQLDPNHHTLAGVLAAHGYDTRAFCSGPHLDPDTGLATGFGAWSFDVNARSLAWGVNQALDSLAHTPPTAPLFAFVQGYDAHTPYASPALMSEMFGSGPSAEAHAGSERNCGTGRNDPTWACAAPPEAGQTSVPPGALSHTRNHYDAAVRYADHQLGRLLHGLQAQVRLDGAIVVVLSDHGEVLGRDNYFGHDKGRGAAVYQVPLVVKMPVDRPPSRRADLVDLAGLSRSLMRAAQVSPPSGLPERHFLDALDRPAQAPLDLRPLVGASKLAYRVASPDWTLHQPFDQAGTPLPPSLYKTGKRKDLSTQAPEQRDALLAELSGLPRALGDLEDLERSRTTHRPDLLHALQQGGYWQAQGAPP